MSRPIVYLSKDFFVSFCKHLSRPVELVPPAFHYLYEQIFQRAKIFINLDDTEITNIINLQPEVIAKIENEDNRILAGRLNAIARQNRIYSCKNELEIFRAKKYAEFNSLTTKPHFIFLSDRKEFCVEISIEFGVICVSKELELDQQNTRVEIKAIQSDTQIQLDAILKNIPGSHCIIIEDPYLFQNDKKGVFLERFLCKLINKKLKVNHNITIICSGSVEREIELLIQRIKNSSGLNIELFFRSTQNIHDRNVFSNSFYLTCGYGFKEKYKHATEWHIPAIGTYFDQYLDRKMASTKFLKHELKTSNNYLAN